MEGRYLGRTHGFHLDEHVEEGRADLLRGVVEAVLESGEKLFQHRVAERVVQDDRQALRRPSHKAEAVRILPPPRPDPKPSKTDLEDRAAHVRRAAVGRQLHHQLLQKVCDDGWREELPALAQDLTHAQDGSGAHGGMRVV